MNCQGLQLSLWFMSMMQRLFQNHHFLEGFGSCSWGANPLWRSGRSPVIYRRQDRNLPYRAKKRENSNHRILYIGHCRVFLDSLGGLLLVSSLQIQDRLQMLKAAFEFCLCNSEPSPAFSSCLNSNTAKDIMTVSTLPAFFVKQSVCHRDPLWWMLEYFLQGKWPYGMYTALRPTQDVVTLWKDN